MYIFHEYKSKEAFKDQRDSIQVGLFVDGVLDLNQLLETDIEEIALIKDGRVVQLRGKKIF